MVESGLPEGSISALNFAICNFGAYHRIRRCPLFCGNLYFEGRGSGVAFFLMAKKYVKNFR